MKFIKIFTFLVFFSFTQLFSNVVVGSKIDTEGTLLGNIIYLALKDAKLKVVNKIALGNSTIVRKALLNGQIDIYPEYTGNAAFFFKKTKLKVWKDFDKGYKLAKNLDYKENKIIWLKPSNANNTWAIAVDGKIAKMNSLKTMSDFGKFVKNGGKIKLAASSEFVNNPEVLPLFQKVYDFKLKSSQLLILSGGNTATTIKAAAQKTDGVNTAMVYGTDGAISEVGLKVMIDDKNVQPVYAPTPLIREEILRKNPIIASILNPIFESFSLKKLQELNGRIAIGGESPKLVAESYLKANNFIK